MKILRLTCALQTQSPIAKQIIQYALQTPSLNCKEHALMQAQSELDN